MSTFDKMANAFTKAEKSMQISKIGVGGYDVDHGTGKPAMGAVHKPQTPAQHASAKKAGAASAAKRKASAALGGGRGKVFGF
jgi:hypothetical protein